jgi:hypothetical protein
MSATPSPAGISYRKTAPPGAGRYEVLQQGQPIGTVASMVLGAGQFGSRWVATALDGRRSNPLNTREAGAAWLVAQAGTG